VFLLISYEFLLVFTPIFTLKTHKSYKITLYTTANHPVFQKTVKNSYFHLFSNFFYLLFCRMVIGMYDLTPEKCAIAD
ncbi:MAG: hypothetical protein NTX52_14700, partial [Planctomycetota bacterium]|nr:hypothetical protein [Planctomycetota bacterium]